MVQRPVILVLSAVVLGGLLLTTASPGMGFSSGVTDQRVSDPAFAGRPVDITRRGCFCHGTGLNTDPDLAASVPEPGVLVTVSGVPYKYNASQEYELTIAWAVGGPEARTGAESHKGGFLFNASAGTLTNTSDPAKVQIVDRGNATHTLVGDTYRVWNVNWTAPVAASGDVVFHLAVNIVNGDSANDEADRWTLGSWVVLNSTAFAPTGTQTLVIGQGPIPETPAAEEGEAGLFLPAYWVGVIGMLGTIVLIVVTYFVVKAGSPRYTDEKDHLRKGLP